MRYTNSRARQAVNSWLFENGIEPLSAALSYVNFANSLRFLFPGKKEIPPFTERKLAVRFVRDCAKLIDSGKAGAPVAIGSMTEETRARMNQRICQQLRYSI